MSVVKMCSFNPEKPAAFAFRWEWGETGFCCYEQRPLLEQSAVNLGRRIEFSPIDPAAEPPVENAERATLKGRIYALEYDCADLSRARVELSAEVERLATDNRSLRLAATHNKGAYDALQKERNSLVADLEASRSEVRNLTTELAFTRENSKASELEAMAARALEAEAKVVMLGNELDAARAELELLRLPPG